MTGSGYTQADGTYSVGGMTAGNYRVGFFDAIGVHSIEYYDNAPDVDSATDVTVVLGATTGGIDASLEVLGKVEGTVAGADGTTALRDAEVNLFRWDADDGEWVWERTAFTGLDGVYSSTGLPSGTYRVGFSHWQGNHVSEFFENSPDIESASDVTVQIGTITSGINGSLDEKGKIAGTVTGPDGITPLEGIEVNAYAYDVEAGEWQVVRTAHTSVDGGYLFQGFDPGAIRIDQFRFRFAVTGFHRRVGNVLSTSAKYGPSLFAGPRGSIPGNKWAQYHFAGNQRPSSILADQDLSVNADLPILLGPQLDPS